MFACVTWKVLLLLGGRGVSCSKEVLDVCLPVLKDVLCLCFTSNWHSPDLPVLQGHFVCVFH